MDKVNGCKLGMADWWSFGLGLGFLPMSGTMGSLLGLPWVFLFSHLSLWWTVFFIFLVTLVSWIACLQTYAKLGCVDHRAIVSDEVVGMILSLVFVPLTMKSVFLGFFLFRVLDIFKPWPICVFDRMSHWGGHEVMLDDVVAGLITNVILQCLLS